MSSLIESKFRLDDPPFVSYNQKKNDYIRIAMNPGSSGRLNTGGDLIFEVDNQQSYLYLPDSFLHCEYSLYSDAAFTTALPTADNITLENNFFPRLFTQMRLDVSTQNIETISDSPGIIDSMLRFVTIGENNKMHEIEGWFPDNHTGIIVDDLDEATGTAPTKAEYKTVIDFINKTQNSGYKERRDFNRKNNQTVNWSLSPLFGYLDYNKVSCQLKFKLIIHRTVNNELIFYGKTGKKAYLKIERLEWWIKHITPSLEVETVITKRLNSNKPIPVSFMKRIASSVTFSEQRFNWHFTRTSNTPRYMLLAFQKNETPNFEKNNSLFHFETIRSLQISLNQTRYPIDPLKFDNANNQFMEGYDAYRNLCEAFGVNPQLTPNDWKNLFPIFCFDLSAQSEDIIKNGCDVTINIEKNNSTTSLMAYGLLLEDVEYSIEILNGRMVRIG